MNKQFFSVRVFVNKKLRLKSILESKSYSAIIIVICLWNISKSYYSKLYSDYIVNLTIEYFDEEASYQSYIEGTFWLFSVIYGVDIILKVLGESIRIFWAHDLNKYHLLIPFLLTLECRIDLIAYILAFIVMFQFPLGRLSIAIRNIFKEVLNRASNPVINQNSMILLTNGIDKELERDFAF